jgi:hypothetical protein
VSYKNEFSYLVSWWRIVAVVTVVVVSLSCPYICLWRSVRPWRVHLDIYIYNRNAGPHTYQTTPDSAEQNAADILETVELEIGVDVVLDATGAEPCMNCGILVLASGGTFVQVGLGKPNPSWSWRLPDSDRAARLSSD